jgi:hypothetical protein
MAGRSQLSKMWLHLTRLDESDSIEFAGNGINIRARAAVGGY